MALFRKRKPAPGVAPLHAPTVPPLSTPAYGGGIVTSAALSRPTVSSRGYQDHGAQSRNACAADHRQVVVCAQRVLAATGVQMPTRRSLAERPVGGWSGRSDRGEPLPGGAELADCDVLYL